MTDAQLLATLEAARQQVPPGSLWRHWKGSLYRIDCVSISEITGNPMVTYSATDHSLPLFPMLWTRTLEDFLEPAFDPVTRTSSPRFTRESASG